MLTLRRVIAAKIETTEGTKETLTGTESGILAFDPKFEVDVQMTKRNAIRPSLSPLADVPGAQLARLTFRVELKGAGSAYSTSVKPAVGEFLRGCGFAETVDTTVGAETVTYDPASTGHKSMTIALYQDGIRQLMYGARGNVKFTFRHGEPVYADFEFLGVYDGTTDVTLPSPIFESTIPPAFYNSTFTVAGSSMLIEGITIDMGNVLTLRKDVTKTAGYYSAIITGREPNGSFDPEMVAVASHDFYGRWIAGTTGALVIGPVGGTQYNKVTVTAPAVQYRKVADADRDGIAIADTSFLLVGDEGDDEIQIVFS